MDDGTFAGASAPKEEAELRKNARRKKAKPGRSARAEGFWIFRVRFGELLPYLRNTETDHSPIATHEYRLAEFNTGIPPASQPLQLLAKITAARTRCHSRAVGKMAPGLVRGTFALTQPF